MQAASSQAGGKGGSQGVVCARTGAVGGHVRVRGGSQQRQHTSKGERLHGGGMAVDATPERKAAGKQQKSGNKRRKRRDCEELEEEEAEGTEEEVRRVGGDSAMVTLESISGGNSASDETIRS